MPDNVHRTGPFPVRVVVRNDKDKDAPPVHDKTGNHEDKFFRDWIANTTWWAVRNYHSVTLYPDG